MFDIQDILRDNVRLLMPYTSARDAFTGSASVWLDANESPFPDQLNRYPDPKQRQLKKVIGDVKGIEPDSIFLGNGSDEAIDLLIRATCEPGRDKVLLFPPTYGMYRVCAEINAVQVVALPLTPGFQIDVEKAGLLLSDPLLKIIFICSPNNPTGNLMDEADMLRLINAFHGLVVVDEAYIDFAKTGSLLGALGDHPNLVVLQTLSKAWGLAGIRLGIACASPPVVSVLNSIKPPYNVNTLTQQVALDRLHDTKSVDRNVSEIIYQREQLRKTLQELDCVEHVFPSDANFLLCQFTKPKEVFEHLIAKGIIVRDRTTTVKDCLRITIGTAKENKLLYTTLKEFQHATGTVY